MRLFISLLFFCLLWPSLVLGVEVQMYKPVRYDDLDRDRVQARMSSIYTLKGGLEEEQEKERTEADIDKVIDGEGNLNVRNIDELDENPTVLASFRQEREILREEIYALERFRNYARYGNANESDSAFDTVQSLNRLDRILFGEKSEAVEPAFGIVSSTGFTSSAETWQVAESRDYPSNQFSRSDESVSGLLYWIGQRLIDTNAQSLACKQNTSTFWQPPVDAVYDSRRFGVNSGCGNRQDVPKSEQSALTQTSPLKNIADINESFINSQENRRNLRFLRNSTTGIEAAGDAPATVEADRKYDLWLASQNLRRAIERKSLHNEGRRTVEMLDHWDDQMKCFYDEVKALKKDLRGIVDDTKVYPK